MTVHLYLCHGFLGQPEDWDLFIESLQLEAQPLGLRFVLEKKDLWKDFKKIQRESELSGDSVFQVWARHFLRQVNSQSGLKMFLGYSFGGRLLMHMDWQAVKGFLMVGYVAAHPGLLSEQDLSERKAREVRWSQQFAKDPWQQVVAQWNQQEIFAKDKIRPLRDENNYDHEALRIYFENWTVSRQEPRDVQLGKSALPQYWFCGSEDSKYCQLLPRMQKCLGVDKCTVIPGSGHGVLWDGPSALAKSVCQLLGKENFQKIQGESLS